MKNYGKGPITALFGGVSILTISCQCVGIGISDGSATSAGSSASAIVFVSNTTHYGSGT